MRMLRRIVFLGRKTLCRGALDRGGDLAGCEAGESDVINDPRWHIGEYIKHFSELLNCY